MSFPGEPDELICVSRSLRHFYRGLIQSARPAPVRPRSREVVILQPSAKQALAVQRGYPRLNMELPELYARRGFSVRVVEDPRVESVLDIFEGGSPAVIHIHATMKQSRSLTGAVLDFAGEEPGTSAYSSEVFNAARLARLTATYQSRPLIVLDIADPPGLTESLRQLLLRNAFAHALFRFDTKSAILATGLAYPSLQRQLAELTADGLGEGAPVGEVCDAIRRFGLADQRNHIHREELSRLRKKSP
jgi:hypothetical protein